MHTAGTAPFAQANPDVASLAAPKEGRSATLLTDLESWHAYRAAMRGNAPALATLRRAADRCLTLRRLSVVDKKKAPEGGTLHDYTSMGPYWWPDPEKPDGLPYVRRDGEWNPESGEGDRRAMMALCDAVSALVNQAWLDDSPGRASSLPHARQAGRLLRAWFLDGETRMNPHLSYAQAIPGRTPGRGIGIIDTNVLCFLLDEVGLLEHMADASRWGDDVWGAADREGLRRWFSDYTDWLLTSKNGGDEAREKNNHGTWYDAQVAAFAAFAGRPDIARAQTGRSARGRIGGQIADDGSQPHELARTLSLDYTHFNLLGFVVLASVDAGLRDGASDGDAALWRWKAGNGASITTALDWLLPYALGERPWTHTQIKAYEKQGLAAWIYWRAGKATGDARYAEAARKIAAAPWDMVSRFGAGAKAGGE